MFTGERLVMLHCAHCGGMFSHSHSQDLLVTHGICPRCINYLKSIDQLRRDHARTVVLNTLSAHKGFNCLPFMKNCPSVWLARLSTSLASQRILSVLDVMRGRLKHT